MWITPLDAQARREYHYYMEQEKTCSICQSKFVGWGNNAQPVNDGTCCDDCNSAVVIPARLTRIWRENNPLGSVEARKEWVKKNREHVN